MDLEKLFVQDRDREPLICAHLEENPIWVTMPGNRYQLRYCQGCLIELYARTSIALRRRGGEKLAETEIVDAAQTADR